MPCARAYLSNFFYYLGRNGHFDDNIIQGFPKAEQWLLRALFAGAEVSVVVDECCCSEGDSSQRLGNFFHSIGQGAGFDLDELFWEFQDRTGLDLSITQRFLLRAMFDSTGEEGTKVCLSMSGGPGIGRGDYDWGASFEGVGGGRGEERPPGGGRGDERGPGGGRGDYRGPGGGH